MTGSPAEPGGAGAFPTPRPVPEAVAVTDDDRNRYGLLLDRAAERGLLDPHEYEVRLKDLAAASTIDQMKRIVTELPVFVPGTAPARGSPMPGQPPHRGIGRPGALGVGSRRPAGPDSRSSPWLLLAVVVAVVAASLVFLALFAGHIVHTRNAGLEPPGAATNSGVPLRSSSVSAPRP